MGQVCQRRKRRRVSHLIVGEPDGGQVRGCGELGGAGGAGRLAGLVELPEGRHLVLEVGEGGLGPSQVAAALEDGGAEADATVVPGWLLPDSVPRSFSAIDPAVDRALDLLPTRISINEGKCRGCARCIDVCSFGAIQLVDETAPETTVRVSAALCRGCNLCTAVCPTDAAIPATVAPGWWGTKIEDLYPSLIAASSSQPPLVALACQRRAGAVQESLARSGLPNLAAQVVPIRCAGQIDAGMLLELYRHGAGRILVAGCLTGSCRYTCGPQLAAEQVLRAQAVLRQLGADPDSITTDWAAEETEQLADPQLLMSDSKRSEPSVADARGGPQ